jgi:hypothetical protein
VALIKSLVGRGTTYLPVLRERAAAETDGKLREQLGQVVAELEALGLEPQTTGATPGNGRD